MTQTHRESRRTCTACSGAVHAPPALAEAYQTLTPWRKCTECLGASAPHTYPSNIAHRMPWRQRTSRHGGRPGANAPHFMAQVHRMSWRKCTASSCEGVSRADSMSQACQMSWRECTAYLPRHHNAPHALSTMHVAAWRTSWRGRTAFHGAARVLAKVYSTLTPWRKCTECTWRECSGCPGAIAPHVMAQVHRML